MFTDIDDTITTEGRLPAAAFRALWDLHRAGIHVVPVTGRPAGWCDHIARMWPVAGVVGENGAFYFRYDPEARRLQSSYALPEAERAVMQDRLRALRNAILKDVPGARVASDQAYRIHDLAIDYCEDVSPLSPAEVDRIVRHFEAAGATAKVSSIHVNGWFGTYDKLGMMKRLATEVLDFDLSNPENLRRAVYVGDSPNDEPGFEAFPLSVGVANIVKQADRLVHRPAYVTRAAGGEGFAEFVRYVLDARQLAGGPGQ